MILAPHVISRRDIFDAFTLPRLVGGCAIAGAAVVNQAQRQARRREHSTARSLTRSLTASMQF